jgi:phospholipase/lecithinase/hemolysin
MGSVKKLSMATAGAVFISLGTGLSYLGEPAKAASFTNIYAFGDSLSDTGNVFNITSAPPINLPAPPPPYFEGHFSNGPVWVESLASKLGLTISPSTAGGNNFAYGGAESGTQNVGNPLLKPFGVTLPGLQQEVQSFIGGLPNQAADPKALYTVWAGGDDYLGGGQTTDTATIGNLLNAVTSLNDIGAKNIMVVNLPDLGKIPRTLNTPEAPALSDLSKQHNSDLALALANLSQDRGSSINIIPLDVYSTFETIIADPAKYGFTNVTEPCLNTTTFQLCSDQKSVQDQYFSWDGLHPTARSHQIVAESAFLALKSKPVPEPASTLGVLAFGALGVGSLLRRRQKQQRQKAASQIKKVV